MESGKGLAWRAKTKSANQETKSGNADGLGARGAPGFSREVQNLSVTNGGR